MKKRVVRVISFLFAAVGGVLMLSAIAPMVSYEITSRQHFQQYLSPVPEEEFADLTKMNQWFPNAEQTAGSDLVKFYNLSIPKLGIEGAVVSIGGEDLADSLIQYPGTAVPGKIGNAVVFGHSVLPAFYDPKVYLSIFSTLPTLKKKDLVEIDYDGISYQYRVEDMYEVSPTELSVLNQDSNAAYISLITCVPPGDPRSPRRLVVRAKLVPPAEKTLTYDTTRI